jgi:hypothetical protein
LKLTLSAAMRARDVSRPAPEHIAEAEAAEAGAAGVETQQARPTDGPPATDGSPPKRNTRNVRRFKLR